MPAEYTSKPTFGRAMATLRGIVAIDHLRVTIVVNILTRPGCPDHAAMVALESQARAILQ